MIEVEHGTNEDLGASGWHRYTFWIWAMKGKRAQVYGWKGRPGGKELGEVVAV